MKSLKFETINLVWGTKEVNIFYLVCSNLTNFYTEKGLISLSPDSVLMKLNIRDGATSSNRRKTEEIWERIKSGETWKTYFLILWINRIIYFLFLVKNCSYLSNLVIYSKETFRFRLGSGSGSGLGSGLGSGSG